MVYYWARSGCRAAPPSYVRNSLHNGEQTSWSVITASWFIATKYRSDTVIIIEQQKVPEDYVVPNVAVDLQGRLQSMTQQILSRTRLKGIIEKLRLYGVGQKRADADSLVERMRQ